MLIRMCLRNYRSLRDLILMLFFIVSVSMIMTLHIGNNLPWRHQHESEKVARAVYNAAHSTGYHGFQKTNQRWHSNLLSSPQILWRLLKIEDKTLGTINSQKVFLSGTARNMDEKIKSLYRKFNERGFTVMTLFNKDRTLLHQANGSLVYCLESIADTTCKQFTDDGSCKYQKLPGERFRLLGASSFVFGQVNRIPELYDYLSEPGAICDLQKRFFSHGETEVAWKCSKLPTQNSEHKTPIHKGENSSSWAISTDRDGSLKIFHTNWTADDIKDNKIEGDVLWTVPNNTGTADWYLRLYTLVTSFLPQRSYLYPIALLHSVEHTLKKNSGFKIVEIKKFLTELEEKFQNVTAESLMESLKEAIFKSLIGMEFDTLKVIQAKQEDVSRSTGCFQLLEYYVTFDSKFQPLILQIRPYSYGDSMYEDLMTDAADMLLSQTKVAIDVARALEETVTDMHHMDCDSDSSLCLSEEDYTYLLHDRRESVSAKSFMKIYPPHTAADYSSLINQLQHPVQGQSRTLESIGDGDLYLENSSPKRLKSTADLHSLLLGLEKFYNQLDNGQIQLYEDNISLNTKSYLQDGELSPKPQENRKIKDNCSQDQMDIPLVSGIFTEPEIDFSPEFSPHISEYHAIIDYDTFLIKIWAEARSCNCEARLDDKYGTSRPLNYTLGIGFNQIAIIVVDLSHNSPWVVNSYSLHIHRRDAEYELLSFSPKISQVCSLKQDCSMTYSPNDLCGLQFEKSYSRWSAYQETLRRFPPCESGDIAAKWMVPCINCNESNTCYWTQAVWQPENCKYNINPEDKAKQCLKNKKVLFIGDSTNRGILHYITGKINSSLQDWDKTHDIKIYDNINGNETVLSFAYYPQFWLPVSHRPTFIKALYQLIKRTLPLTNDSNTALVVGGVHWLAKHHIKVILSALEREGLTGITLIMKGLGAGFHQQVEGVRYVPQEDQYKLLLHEQDVSMFARQHGFHVVETYNMTIARYKHFLQGKCACHFHKVVRVQNQHKNIGIKNRTSPLYHVEGQINSIYSEMVIDQICRLPDR